MLKLRGSNAQTRSGALLSFKPKITRACRCVTLHAKGKGKGSGSGNAGGFRPPKPAKSGKAPAREPSFADDMDTLSRYDLDALLKAAEDQLRTGAPIDGPAPATAPKQPKKTTRAPSASAFQDEEDDLPTTSAFATDLFSERASSSAKAGGSSSSSSSGKKKATALAAGGAAPSNGPKPRVWRSEPVGGAIDDFALSEDVVLMTGAPEERSGEGEEGTETFIFDLSELDLEGSDDEDADDDEDVFGDVIPDGPDSGAVEEEIFDIDRGWDPRFLAELQRVGAAPPDLNARLGSSGKAKPKANAKGKGKADAAAAKAAKAPASPKGGAEEGDGWEVLPLGGEGAGAAGAVADGMDGWSVTPLRDLSPEETAIEALLFPTDGSGTPATPAPAPEEDEEGFAFSSGMNPLLPDDDISEEAETKLLASPLLKRSLDSKALEKAAKTVMDTMPSHLVRQLEEDQRAADENNQAVKAAARKRADKERKTHKKMRIIGGTAAGRFIISSQGETTRPMMEKVRSALFSMLNSAAGGQIPPTCRWLDLFAGTGAIGIEALSRGCREGHFVELDPWVAKTITSANLATCGVDRKGIVHVADALQFLRRAETSPKFAGGPFDYISACPPYEKVSYTELMGLLDRSPLLHENSVVIVEYAQKQAAEVPQSLGPLVRLKDRRYGRTLLAIFGPVDEE